MLLARERPADGARRQFSLRKSRDHRIEKLLGTRGFSGTHIPATHQPDPSF